MSSDTIVQHSAGPSSSSINQIPDIIVSQQTTVLSPKSDELVRRHQQKQYEDYESDDELRREDISFPIDGGLFSFTVTSHRPKLNSEPDILQAVANEVAYKVAAVLVVS